MSKNTTIQSIVLASASPRRKELLHRMGIDFEVCPSTVEEKITKTEPNEVVMELALQKAADVYARMKDKRDDLLVIGADTIVAFGGEILGKPIDEMDAYRMLNLLQGNTHQVYTGVALIGPEKQTHVFYTETEVSVAKMSDAEIRAYVKSGDPMDKAGAYGIQTQFGRYIEKINGDYNNVVGLPVSALYAAIRDQGYEIENAVPGGKKKSPSKNPEEQADLSGGKNESKTSENTDKPSSEKWEKIRASLTPQVKQIISFICILVAFALFSLIAIVIWVLPPDVIKIYQKGFLLVIDFCVVVFLYFWAVRFFK